MATTAKAGVYKSITAQNTFSDPWAANKERPSAQISIYGTFSATVFVQIKRSDQAGWRDVDSFTAPVERIYDFVGEYDIRAGVKTGGFTSGTVEIEIS